MPLFEFLTWDLKGSSFVEWGVWWVLKGGILSRSCSHSSSSAREVVRSKNYLEKNQIDTYKNGRCEGRQGVGTMRVEAYWPGFKFQLNHLLIMVLQGSHFLKLLLIFNWGIIYVQKHASILKCTTRWIFTDTQTNVSIPWINVCQETPSCPFTISYLLERQLLL